MKMVIVSLTYHWFGGERSYDMEIPSHVPAKILVTHISQTLKNYTSGKISPAGNNLRLSCRRLNRVLAPDETFEQAGIWNGDHIDLK